MNLSQLELEESAGLPVRRKEIKREANHKSLLAMRIFELEPSFKWDNKTLFKDRAALYALATEYHNKFGESKLFGLLQWGKSKNAHIKALISCLRKQLVGK